MYQAIYEKYQTLFQCNPVLMLREHFDVLLDYDQQQPPGSIPLANNGEWEDICETYQPEQVEKMFEVVYKHMLKVNKSQHIHLARECKRAISGIKYRNDSYEATINSAIYSQTQLMAALLNTQGVIYNPVILLNKDKYNGDWAPMIFIPSEKFLKENSHFIRRIYYNNSRHLKGYEIYLPNIEKVCPSVVSYEDVMSVNINMYGPMVWQSIINNDFSLLMIK